MSTAQYWNRYKIKIILEELIKPNELTTNISYWEKVFEKKQPKKKSKNTISQLSLNESDNEKNDIYSVITNMNETVVSNDLSQYSNSPQYSSDSNKYYNENESYFLCNCENYNNEHEIYCEFADNKLTS